MDENYTFIDLDSEHDNDTLDNDALFDKHVSQGHPHLIEVDNLLSKAFSNFDVEDV